MTDTDQKLIRRVVVSINDDSDEWPTGEDGKPLLEVIRWFEEKLEKIPEQFRSGAICEIRRGYYEEDVAYAQIQIVYSSPATDREIDWEDRLARKRAMYERTEARKKLREINELFPDLPDWED
jgi:hypothetical protein